MKGRARGRGSRPLVDRDSEGLISIDGSRRGVMVGYYSIIILMWVIVKCY